MDENPWRISLKELLIIITFMAGWFTLFALMTQPSGISQ